MRQSQFIWVDDDNGQQQQEELQTVVPVKQTKKVKTNKIEFVGWGSKKLLDFLASVGVDTAEKLSQEQVTDIIYKYINANNLVNPNKKKRVVCDEKLHLLFGRRTVGRVKISDLLEKHIKENQEDSAFNDDEPLYSSDEDASVTRKRKAISKPEKEPLKRAKQAPASNDSCFAEVIPENIRLVYLKKSLVQELSKDPETFDKKVVGAFVRIKSDPLDYTQKNYYQLVRVTGIKTDDMNKQIFLQVSNSVKVINISMLSDDDFSKEECEDVKRRIKDGLLGRLTVVELEQMAQILHHDITKHWIERELVVLQKLIDRANEKGWRRDFTLSDYIDRKQLLQTPSEQTRLFQELPTVIAEKIVPEPVKETTLDSGPEPEPKEKIIPEPAEKRYSGDVSDDEDDWLDSFLKAAEGARAQVSNGNGSTAPADPAPEAEDQVEPERRNNLDDGLSPAKNHENEDNQDAVQDRAVIARDESISEVPTESPKSEITVSFPNDKLIIPGTDLSVPMIDEAGRVEAECLKSNTPSSNLNNKLSSPFANLTVDVKDVDISSPKHEKQVSKPDGRRDIPAVIELSDEEDNESASSLLHYPPQCPIWEYMDPQGAVQGPFSILAMKRWADACYFPPGFMVWRKGEPHIKLVLADVIRQIFPNNSL